MYFEFQVVCLEHQQITSLSIGSHAAGFKVWKHRILIINVLALTQHPYLPLLPGLSNKCVYPERGFIAHKS